MRVLALSSYGGTGGSELTFAAFLEHRPQHVEARALLVSDGPLTEVLAGIGIETAAGTGYEGRPTAAALGRFARSLGGLLDRDRPDVVWAMGQKGALLAAAACRAKGVPLVWHKVDFSWDRSLAKPVALAVDGVVAVSEAVAEALGPLRGKLLGVVWPPVTLDPQLRASPDPEAPAIGTLGRLVPYKGHHLIVRAAALLADEFPSLRVVLAGDTAPQYPGYRGSLLELAADSGLGERVEVPGFLPAPEVLGRLNVFVNATYRDEDGFGLEGLSGAMLEASWAGIPVVATRGGGTAEGLVDGETGTLIDTASPEALAGAIGPYLRDPDLAARAGAAGRDFAHARFAPNVASKRLFDLLAKVTPR
jgi:glycosyltransferase involved in cell wall biosynthesis